jgi:hypothetical protein
MKKVKNESKQYLMPLSSEHYSQDLVDRVIEDCLRREADLFVVYVVKPTNEMEIGRLSEQSFLPPGQSKDVAEEVKRTTLKTALSLLKEIEVQAQESGVSCESNLIEGVFDEETLGLASRASVTRIYLCGKSHGALGRLFFENEVDRVLEKAGCRVIISSEEGSS